MYRCVYCGSTDMVHDPSRGYIVCSSCGSVNDIIYNSDSELYSRVVDPREGFGNRLRGFSSRKSRYWWAEAGLGSAGRAYRIYRELVGSKRLRKGVFISGETLQDFMAGHRPQRIYDHTGNKVVIEFLERSPVLKKVIDIMKEYPSIYSRTARGRVAAAYIAAKMVIRDPISLSTLSRFFSLSKAHLGRIKSILEGSRDLLDRISYIEDLPKEIAEADMFIKKHIDL